jgi:hypothetical protein
VQLKEKLRLLYLLDDKTIACLGLVFSLVIIAWSSTTGTGRMGRIGGLSLIVGILSSFACAGYIGFKKAFIRPADDEIPFREGKNKPILALNFFFLATFCYTIFSIYTRPDPYNRPIDYFVAIILMVVLVALEIFFSRPNDCYTYSVLSKSIAIGLNLVFSQLIIFPNLIGVDPWWHQMFTLKIVNDGRIPEGYGYSKLPFMHLLISMTSMISGLDYKMAAFFSVTLPQIICVTLVVFLLGNLLFGRRVGLLSGLLLVIADLQVLIGVWTVPNTMGIILVLIVIYLMLKPRKEDGVSRFIVGILMFGIILTHSLSAVFMSILLFMVWLGSKIHNRIYSGREMPVTLGTFMSFTTAMLGWWTFVSGDIIGLVEGINSRFDYNYYYKPLPEDVILYANQIPFVEQIFIYFGMILFFALSVVGCLYMISKEYCSHRRFVFVIAGTTPLAIGFLALISGRMIVTERWLYLSEILLSLPLSLSIFLFSYSLKHKLVKSILFISLVSALSFFMILNPTANPDGAVFSSSTDIRYAFTHSELQAIDRMSNLVSTRIGVDIRYSDVGWMGYRMVDISEQLYSRNYTKCRDDFVLIRSEIVEHPFTLFYTVYKLNYDPREALTDQGFSRVYDSFYVTGFVFTQENSSTPDSVK